MNANEERKEAWVAKVEAETLASLPCALARAVDTSVIVPLPGMRVEWFSGGAGMVLSTASWYSQYPNSPITHGWVPVLNAQNGEMCLVQADELREVE
jgi:hypothetical protein